MNFSRSDIIEYFDEIKNQIDIKCEQSLQETEESKRPQIESIRTKFMDEINETFKCNLNKFESVKSSTPEQVDFFDWKFCLYIPVNMNFTPCGILVLTNQYLNHQIRSYMKQVYMEEAASDLFQDLTTKEALLGTALFSLIDETIFSDKTDGLINLRDPTQNKIRCFDVGMFKINSLTSNDLRLLDQIINKKYVKECILDLDVTHLESDIFSYFDQIKSLDLTLNEPCQFESKCFNGLVNLKNFLIYNFITESIEDDIFIGMDKLEFLGIRESRIDSLGDHAFSNLPKIDDLSILNSSLKRIGSNAFKDLKGLKSLNMYDNELISLPTDVFNDLNSLVALNLHNALKTQIDAKMFSCLKNLEFLSLFQGSELVVNLDELNLPNLKYLAINSKKVPGFDLNLDFLFINGIDELNENSFNKLLGLKGLSIDTCGAYFENFKSEKVFSKMENLKYLMLKFDDLDAEDIDFCSNNQEFFKSILKTNGVTFDFDETDGYRLEMTTCQNIYEFFKKELNADKVAKEAIDDYHKTCLI